MNHDLQVHGPLQLLVAGLGLGFSPQPLQADILTPDIALCGEGSLLRQAQRRVFEFLCRFVSVIGEGSLGFEAQGLGSEDFTCLDPPPTLY